MSESKGKKKPKLVYRSTGTIDHLLYESVFFEKKPRFLILEDGNFLTRDKMMIGETILLPLTDVMIPYQPYKLDREKLDFINSWKPSTKEVYDLVYPEYDVFLDLEPQYKTLETVQTIESYEQHKIMTTSYLFHYGGTDSGKTRALEVHNFLDYRPLMSVSLPSADVYTFLGFHDEGCGTILEDEAEDLNKRRHGEKMKLYRAGYRKGATVPRIEWRGKTRIQRFFKAFCCKCFAGRYLPYDEAFKGRCIPINMVEGVPDKDEFTRDDYTRFDEIKAKLLAWRMKTYFDELPNVETGLHGRVKELWKPKLQIANGLTTVETVIEALALDKMRRKEEERRTCLEAYLTKAVARNYIDMRGQEIPFFSIWNMLKVALGVDDRAETEDGGTVKTPQFGDVTKQSVGRKLSSIFGGKRHLRGKGIGRTYVFDKAKLRRLTKRYRVKKNDVEALKIV